MWLRERPRSAETTLCVADALGPNPPDEGPDATRLRRWVERLAFPRHRFAHARENHRARAMVADAFASAGLSVRLQGRFRNVVALPRSPRLGGLTLVAAHYDSVPNCPGADDNASALAVMLECARVIGEHRAPVAFVAFNAEEDGLLGSRDFVDNGLGELPGRVRVAHVLEMLGYCGASRDRQHSPLWWAPSCLEVPDFLGVVANGRSNPVASEAHRSSASPDLRLVTMKTWGPIHRVFPDLGRSDHLPFWAAGIPAVLWTDTGNFRNPHYHLPTDTPDTLDYGFLHRVGLLVCAVVRADCRHATDA